MDKLPLPEATLWQGCGDSSCIVRVQKGQHTNGGCRCHSLPIFGNVRKAFQQLYLDREYFRNLAGKAAPVGSEGPVDVARRYLEAVFGKRGDGDPVVIEFLEASDQDQDMGFTKWASSKALAALRRAPEEKEGPSH